MNTNSRTIIVGAGHGGSTAAALLRQHGFAGEVVLIGSEASAPYQRPPLSKGLTGEGLEQPLMPASFYAEQAIELRLGVAVEEIDAHAKTVRLADGAWLGYDALILATGSAARGLPVAGAELSGVHQLRTIDDAQSLRATLRPGTTLAVVGGGWIGLEVAASARAIGVEVVVIEREERVLARVASRELSAYIGEQHRAQGIVVHTGAQVAGFTGSDGRVEAVELADGHAIACDAVLVGVGAIPHDRLAREAGLECDGGVVVDALARTSDPAIYAIGDVTVRPLERYEGRFRIESIPSAMEQARQAVAAILDQEPPKPEVPWFWSDQFALKVQIAGLIGSADRVTVRHYEDEDRLAVFHTADRELVAIEAVGSPGDFMAGKRMIRDRVRLDVAALADPSVVLKTLLDGGAANGAGAPAVAAPAPPERRGDPRVTLVQPDGSATTIEVASGVTLMEAAVTNNVPGIIAECGGTCSCGTCHVFVDDAWVGRLEAPDDTEAEMLDFVDGASPCSRLACQCVMRPELDGLVVRVPESQG